MDVFHVLMVVTVAAVFVSTWTAMMGPPLPIWRGTLPAEAEEPRASGSKEFRIAGADDHGGVFEEPCRKAAEFPLRAGVGAGTEDDVQAFLLGFTDELGTSRLPVKS